MLLRSLFGEALTADVFEAVRKFGFEKAFACLCKDPGIELMIHRQMFIGVDGKPAYLICNRWLKSGKAFMGKRLSIRAFPAADPEGN